MRANEFVTEEAKSAKYNGLVMRYAFNDNALLLKAFSSEGPLAFVKFVKEKKELYPQNLWVHDDYRNRGIAKSMYDYLKGEGYIINRSHDQTKAGAGFWDKHRGEDAYVWEENAPIKISGNNIAKEWIEKVYAKYPHTMQNNHVMIWGEGEDQQFAMFELTPSFSKRGAVEVKWFQAYPLRQGVGSRAMRELQALAKEDGITLTLFPWDKGQVSQSKLTKFYKGQGFTPTQKGSKSMFWDPSVNEEVLDEMPLPADWDPSEYGPGSTFKKRLAYALERAKRLGTGSSRVATIIEYQGRPTVLKIAKNQKGLAQNSVEADILSDGYASQLGILIPIIDYDTQNREPTWVHTEMATKTSEKQLCSIMKCANLHILVNMAWAITGKKKYIGNYEGFVEHLKKNSRMTDEDIETLTEYANTLADLNSNFDVELGDFTRSANWGMYQGKPVIIDVGFNSNVLNQYYKR